MFRLMTILSVCGLLTVAAAASADDKPKGEKGKGKHDPEAIFKKLDTDGDGKLSKEEFAKFGEQFTVNRHSKQKYCSRRCTDPGKYIRPAFNFECSECGQGFQARD